MGVKLASKCHGFSNLDFKAPETSVVTSSWSFDATLRTMFCVYPVDLLNVTFHKGHQFKLDLARNIAAHAMSEGFIV